MGIKKDQDYINKVSKNINEFFKRRRKKMKKKKDEDLPYVLIMSKVCNTWKKNG